ncbi:MAG TPA: glycosyltransferase [Baekduia sp.]|uniref:glycosyltransferase n=1 Tax=Baekduia sp. TaxID=2600305 RepID=UPI002C6FBC00|nr:glycosyltransferase [Baekduia sp.]HMJ33627.1 glycosyltransferase [Baekduia sp.]
MSPELAVVAGGTGRARLSVVPDRPLRIADVALFYGGRSGGIRTYLDAKAEHAARTGEIEHHVLVPGARERHADGRHELPSVRVVAANGYRLPLGAGALTRTLRELRPDVVLLHDPFWWPADVAACAREIGARTVAVHHGTSSLEAAALPGPSRLYAPLLRTWLRRAARHVDAVMSNVDTMADCGRLATMPLRLGVHDAFRPRSDVRRGDHVLYVGRLSREKGVLELLDAAARSADPWPLRLVGSGPLEETLRTRAERLGLGARISFRPHTRDPERLARRYAAARCVVMPGEHETFGLVALEAAACGAPVAACSTAPALHAIGDLGHGFVPGDPDDLDRAIVAARAAPADPAAAATLAWRHRWDRVFRAELASLRDLLG